MDNETANLFFGFVGGMAGYTLIEIVKYIRNWRGKFGIEVINTYKTARRGLFYRIIYVDLYSTKIERAYIKDIKIVHEDVPDGFTAEIFILKNDVNNIDSNISTVKPEMVKGEFVETRPFIPQWITTEKWVVVYTTQEYLHLKMHHTNIWIEYTTMDETTVRIPIEDIENTR